MIRGERRSTALMLGLVCLLVPAVAGAVPLEVPVQGLLRDNAGVPVVEDVFQVTFALYGQAEGGEVLWIESWPPGEGDCLVDPTGCVHVTAGTFHVRLGAHAPLDSALFAGGGELWLGMTVETDPELPRRPLGSAPFAMHAGAADHLDCTGCVEAEMLTAQARDTLRGEAVAEVQGFGYITEAQALDAVASAGYSKTEDLVVSEANLPPDGLNEVSNGLLSNQFEHTFAADGPVDIPDNNPFGAVSAITVPDVGLAKGLLVHVDIANSDMSAVTVNLIDPAGETHVLWAESGPGDGLVATYPQPDAQVSGDLSTWQGNNPKGLWALEVLDDVFFNNDVDGAINAWSIQVDTVSNQKVAATGNLEVAGSLEVGQSASVSGTLEIGQGASVAGDLEVGGTITGPGGIVVGASEAPCDAEHAGAIRFDPESQRLTFCTGTELLQLKACTTECPPPDDITCGLPVKNGCDGPCAGTGTALDPVQCLSKVSTTPCGETVLDGCDNSCNQTGTGLNVEVCPAPDTVLCNAPVLDACGNGCGDSGSAFDATQCPAPALVACGLPSADLCGNDCGVVGSSCPGDEICSAGQCVKLGAGPEHPAITCKEILNTGASNGSSQYWLDPDGLGGVAPFDVFCDMETEGGGWIRIDYAADLPFLSHFPGQSDSFKYLPSNLDTVLGANEIQALHAVTTEGRQQYVQLCEGVISYESGGDYTHALGFRLANGVETPHGQASYSPFDVSVTQDGCQSNGGEGGSLAKATIFQIRDPGLPITNVHTNDNSDGELFGSPLTDNPAWLR